MTDLIDRQAAIDKMIWYDDEEYMHPGFIKTEHAIKMLKDLPSVQTERKRGKWIPIQRTFFSKKVVHVKCSECGNLLDLIGVNCGRGDANYCPNCGAKMEGSNG